MGAQLIDETERDDFVNGIRHLGYRAKDFVVMASPRVEVRLPSEQFALRQQVTVHRRSTMILRTYQGGDGYAWAAAALHEVEKGAFGAK